MQARRRVIASSTSMDSSHNLMLVVCFIIGSNLLFELIGFYGFEDSIGELRDDGVAVGFYGFSSPP